MSDATAEPATTGTNSRRSRRPVMLVVITTAALTLLYVGFFRLVGPDLDGRVLVAGMFLIAVCAGVCLNACTMGAASPARYAERTVLRAHQQENPAG